MSFLKFLTDMKPYISPANVGKRAAAALYNKTNPLQSSTVEQASIKLANMIKLLEPSTTAGKIPTAGSGGLKDSPLVYPSDLFSPVDTKPASPFIVFIERDGLKRDSVKGKLGAGRRIALYMPPQIKVGYKATWSEVDLLVSKNNVNAVLSDIQNVFNEIDRTGEIDLKGPVAVKAAKDAAATLTQTAARGYAKQFAKSSIGQSASSATGLSVNPMMGLAFNQIEFRSFQFTFELIARTQTESDTIRDIIKVFKNSMHPEPSTIGTSYDFINNVFGSIFMNYPNTYDILLFAGSNPNSDYLFNFERCVIENVDVNYNGGNFTSFFTNGAPSNIELTISFKETELLTKDRIALGY